MSRRNALLLATAVLTLPGTARAQLAERLYGDACTDGDTSACIVFGLMSELGEGVGQDYGRARSLYRRACEEGDLVGCTNLGLMYEEGRGAPPDRDEARGRYEIACEGDERLACDLLEAMDRASSDSDELRYTKRGRVADAETTTPLADVLIEVPQLGIQQVADGQGYVTLGQLPEGTYELTAKRLGYTDLQGELEVPGQAEFLVLMDRSETT
jgi:hypothetical protein